MRPSGPHAECNVEAHENVGKTASDVTDVADSVPFFDPVGCLRSGSTGNIAVHDIVKASARIKSSYQATQSGDPA